MYDVKPNLIIGFHGCDADVCKALLNNPDKIKINKNPYDWLGHGMYFWENNYERALQWAIDKQKRGSVKEPTVIGGIVATRLLLRFFGCQIHSNAWYLP